MNIHWRNWCWSWSFNTLATRCKELTPWKIPWCLQRLKAGGEGDDRGWDSWMASSTWWTCVWASSGSWWWTGKSGMLQSMGSQRVGHDWATELNFHGYIDHVLKAENSSHSLLTLTLWFSTIMKNLSTLSEWSLVHYTKCYSEKLQPRQRMCSSVLWPLFQTLGSYSIRGSVSSHNYSVDPDCWAWDSGLTLACSSYCVIPFSGSLSFLSIHSPPVHSWSHHSKAKRNIYGQSASGSLEILLCIAPVKVIPVPHYFDNFKFVSYIHDSTYVLQISSFALSLSLFFLKTPYISDIIWYLSFSLDLLHLLW